MIIMWQDKDALNNNYIQERSTSNNMDINIINYFDIYHIAGYINISSPLTSFPDLVKTSTLNLSPL